ncbi:MAG: nuclear export factor [Gemmatimonadetes bacterium]|nr:nuclear export factor [Gemmatimonadota bacterium]
MPMANIRRALAAAASLAALLSLPTLLFGHAVVFPKASTTGAYEKYVLRVPNEKQVATTRVEIRFPAGVRVTAFADVPGWQLEVLTDSAKRVTGAVWTGALAPRRFVEFSFVAANPRDASSLAWPTFQTYADGQRVEWTGPPGSKSPASVTVIGTATAATPPATYASWAALAMSLVALGFALRKNPAPQS